MNKSRWALVPILLATIGSGFAQNDGQARTSSTPTLEAEPVDSSAGRAKSGQQPIDENTRQVPAKHLDEEALQLLEDVRSILKKGDITGFHVAMDSILHRYTGDPNPLVLELIDLLDHENPQVGIHMADILLLTSLETDLARRKLLEVIRSPGALMSERDAEEEKILGTTESGPEDLRILAANTVAKYGIKEASGDVWDLYQRTKDQKLVRPLRRLNEPRMIDELRARAVKNPTGVENMKLIGEYRFGEALPELKKRHEDKNSSAKMRFRTLFPLWRITGEEKYFDEFAASFLPSTIPASYLALGGERERRYLTEMLSTAKSDQLYQAAMALHLRFHDDGLLKKILAESFRNVPGSSWNDAVLARRLVGSIDDEELTKIARDRETKYPTGYYDRDVIYKKKWRYPEWETRLFFD